MILNDQQRDAVTQDGHTCLVACPGSGKTRTIIAKILRCVSEVSGSTRRIACITYTNTAVDEIESRLREYGSGSDLDYCEVGTIHSFCLNNILRPHYHRLPELAEGFKVLPPDSPEWRELVDRLARVHNIDRRRLDYFSGVQRDPDGSLFHPDAIPRNAAADFVKYMDENAQVTFADIVYHSCSLIRAHEFIGRGLASRFAWMLIDEFQDTSKAQVLILNALARFHRTTFFVVGDPNQSIMGFAGARPELMRQFATSMHSEIGIVLSGNYRCSQLVVDDAERLIATKPRMTAVGPTKSCPLRTMLVNAASCADCVFDHFLPTLDSAGIRLGDAAILAPWWSTLYPLAKALREKGVPVIGPGSRPYHRAREFSDFSEHLSAYAEEKGTDLFRRVQRSLFIMLLNITGDACWDVYSYAGRRCLYMMLAEIQGLAKQCRTAVAWLVKAADAVTRALVAEGFMPPSLKHVLPESAEQMIADMQRNKVDMANLTTGDLGVYARPKECLHLMSMHASKGREFDAVAIVNLHDGVVPDFRAKTQSDIDEDRRQLYVAMTRPRKLLMYCTDSSDWRNRPSPFLQVIGVV